MAKRNVYQVSVMVNGKLEFINVATENAQKAAFDAAMFLRDNFEGKKLNAELVSVTYHSNPGKTKVE